MSSIFEELYYGNIHPYDRVYSQDSHYSRLAQLKRINYEKLVATLDESEKDLLEKYIEAEFEQNGIVCYDTFTYAIKLGIMLMAETFAGAGQVTGYGKAD